MLSTKSIIALVGGVVALVLSLWNLGAKIDAQQRASEADAKIREATEKVREVQLKSLGDAVTAAQSTAADAKRQYELMRYDFQALKDTLQPKGKQP